MIEWWQGITTPGAVPPLGAPGAWHTDEWVGAVLTADHLVRESSDAQASMVDSFVRSSLTASKRLLGDSEDGS